MFPDLIADHVQVVLPGNGSENSKLFHLEELAGWVVGIVDKDRARFARYRRFQFISVDPPFGRPKRNLDRNTASSSDHRRIAVVGRREDDDLVTGLDRGEDRGTKRFRCPT